MPFLRYWLRKGSNIFSGKAPTIAPLNKVFSDLLRYDGLGAEFGMYTRIVVCHRPNYIGAGCRRLVQYSGDNLFF